MKFRKRQLILASLVVVLGTAVYLNWQFSDNKTLQVTDVLDNSDELGEARYVNNTNFSDKLEAKSQESVSEKTKTYFAQAQLNKQKSHDATKEKLKDLLSYENINIEAKESLKKGIDEVSKNEILESNIENLIKSKGFEQCIAFIESGECNVVVNPGSINENSAIIIKDIVSGQTNIPGNKIKIIEAK